MITDVPRFNLSRYSNSGSVNSYSGSVTGASRLHRVLLVSGSSQYSTIGFYNNTAGSGTELVGMGANAGNTTDVCFDEVGCVAFDTAMSLTLFGYGATAYAWWE